MKVVNQIKQLTAGSIQEVENQQFDKLFEARSSLVKILGDQAELFDALKRAQGTPIYKPIKRVRFVAPEVDDVPDPHTLSLKPHKRSKRVKSANRPKSHSDDDDDVDDADISKNVVELIVKDDVTMAYLVFKEAHTFVKYINNTNVLEVTRNFQQWKRDYDTMAGLATSSTQARGTASLIAMKLFVEDKQPVMLTEMFLKFKPTAYVRKLKERVAESKWQLRRELEQMKSMNYGQDPISFVQAFRNLSCAYENVRKSKEWILEQALVRQAFDAIKEAKRTYVRGVLSGHEDRFKKYINKVDNFDNITQIDLLKNFTEYGELAEATVSNFTEGIEHILMKTAEQLLNFLRNFPDDLTLHQHFYKNNLEDMFKYSHHGHIFNVFGTNEYKKAKSRICENLLRTELKKLPLANRWDQDITSSIAKVMKDYVTIYEWCGEFSCESFQKELGSFLGWIVRDMRKVLTSSPNIINNSINIQCQRTLQWLRWMRKLSQINIQPDRQFPTSIPDQEIVLIASIVDLYHARKRLGEIIIPFFNWRNSIRLGNAQRDFSSDNNMAKIHRMVVQVLETGLLPLIAKASSELNQLIANKGDKRRIYEATVILKTYFSCLGDYRETVPSDEMVQAFVSIDNAHSILASTDKSASRILDALASLRWIL